jgi:ADP-heptose:LPS heptosyltransferase
MVHGSMKKAKQIIIVDFGGVGDLVLAIPFLRGIKKVFPSSMVSVLSAERTGMILKEQPYVADLFLSPLTMLGLLKTGLRLRKKRFDMAINLMPETSFFSSIKMYLLFLMINAGQWVGRNTEGRGFFYDIKVSEHEMQRENEVLMYGRIFKTLSNGDFDERLEYHISGANKKRVEAFLARERRFKKYPLVLVNPGSDWPAKRWPIERYAELVKRLQELFPTVEFGVIGTQGERGLAHVIKEKCGERVFILSGKTTLEMLPAVLSLATLVITNDSGPAHIARAVGVPLVILAGPSARAFLTIKGRNKGVVMQHDVICSPCLKVSCDTMNCWKLLSVDEVFRVTSKMLKKLIYRVDSQGNY